MTPYGLNIRIPDIFVVDKTEFYCKVYLKPPVGHLSMILISTTNVPFATFYVAVGSTAYKIRRIFRRFFKWKSIWSTTVDTNVIKITKSFVR